MSRRQVVRHLGFHVLGICSLLAVTGCSGNVPAQEAAPATSTVTPSPSETPLPTEAPTDTPLPTPTPVGGGSGKIFFFAGQGESAMPYSVNVDGSGMAPVGTLPDGVRLFGSPYGPSMILSPDGSQLAFVGWRTEESAADIYMMSADGSSPAQPFVSDSWTFRSIDGLAWSPDGAFIAFSAFARPVGNPYDVGIFQINVETGEISAVVDNDQIGVVYGSTVNDWSSNGILFSSHTQSSRIDDLFLLSEDGSQATPITQTSEATASGRWSPDGTRIVFRSGGTIQVMNADGSDVLELTNGFQPSWSPDGSKIVYVWSNPDDEPGDYELFVVNADGSDIVQLTADDISQFNPIWQARVP